MTELHQTPTKNHRFLLLDALRGVAAIFVFFWHAPPDLAWVAQSRSFLAVDFFFCLSGFVIAFAYEKRLQETLPLKDYLWARIIRLYPVYLFGIILGAWPGIEMWSSWARIRQHPLEFLGVVLFQLLMLPGFFHLFDVFLFPLNYPSWSMFFEFIANIFYGVSVSRRLLRTWVLIAIILVAGAVFWHDRNSTLKLDVGFQPFAKFYVSRGLLRVLLSFSAGVITLRIWRKTKLPHLTGPVAGVAALATAITLCFLLFSGSQLLHSMAGSLATVLVAFPLLVFAGAHIGVSKRWNPVCEWLGDVSYPFYIVHASVIAIIRVGPIDRWLTAHPPYQLPAILATLIASLCFSTVVMHKDIKVRKRLTAAYKAHTAGQQAIAA